MLLFACVFQTKKRTFHNYQRGCFFFLSRVPFVVPGFSRGSFVPTFLSFFSVCAHLCPAECLGQPLRQQTRKSALLPACRVASSLLPLRPTDCGGRGPSLSKLMARALLPGLKMNRNVVYLKHTRPLPGREITQHTNSRPRLCVGGGEWVRPAAISLITSFI